MSRGRHHDPVERVNEQHAGDLLAVARAFGSHPDATSACAERVGPDGIDLVVVTPRGPAALHVGFPECVVGGGPDRLREAFVDLARQARSALAIDGNESSEP